MIAFFLFVWFITCAVKGYETYSKKQLRGLHEKETYMIIQQLIEKEYQFIYEHILYNAKNGINEIHFTIFCRPQYESLVNDRGKNNKLNIVYSNTNYSQLPDQYRNYMNSILSEENRIHKVFEKVQRFFPDITTTRNPDIEKCKFYTISW